MSKKIIDCATGEIIERDLTSEEIAEEAKDAKAIAKEREAIEMAKQQESAARQAILDRLGLTEEEARLLLG